MHLCLSSAKIQYNDNKIIFNESTEKNRCK